MQCHVRCITDAADSGGIDFGTVEVLHGAEADGPADSVDENGGYGCVGGGLIAGVDEDRHVDGHVNVSYALERESEKHATTTAEAVDKAPGKDHGEDELDNSIGS